MWRHLLILLIAGLVGASAYAGDDASGSIAYSVDLAAPYEKYELTEANRRWSNSLVVNLRYSGEVVHFVQTTLPLAVNDTTVNGVVYQAVEKPEYFYVVPGDAMLKIGASRTFSPGAGGFSMHVSPSQEFVVCLNFNTGGVPILSSSEVSRSLVTWNGRDWRRF